MTESIAVVCYVVQQLPETMPPESPAAVLNHPFLKDKYSVSEKELGGKVDVIWVHVCTLKTRGARSSSLYL